METNEIIGKSPMQSVLEQLEKSKKISEFPAEEFSDRFYTDIAYCHRIIKSQLSFINKLKKDIKQLTKDE